MKTKYFLLYAMILVFNTSIFTQNLINNGATITINSGTNLIVTNGGYYNLTNGGNHGQIDLDGNFYLTGDFVNEATDPAANVFTNVGTNGIVFFNASGAQHIYNTTPNAFINFENIIINSGSFTFLDEGSAATISGDLLVNNGGSFTLSSPTDGESPSGSLITEGSVSGTGELWVNRHFETLYRYQYVGIPVNNAEDSLFDNTGLPNYFNPNLYVYDETYDAQPNPPGSSYTYWTDETYGFDNAWDQVAVDGSNELLSSSNAEGYVTYNELELDVNFGGSPSNLNNNSSYTALVSYTVNDAAYFDGWNIIGNPYPSALDAHSLTLSNIDNTIYYWDGDAGNYEYYNFGAATDYYDGSNVLNNGSRYIPAMQAFSVKANAAGPSLTISSSDRVHNNQQMFKSPAKESDIQYIKLKTEFNGFSDETVVRFIEGSKPEFDNLYDAYKMFPRETDKPTVYSLIMNPEIPIAINTYPISSLGTTVPLGFNMGSAGSYSLSVKEFNFPLNTEVKLVDSYLETETILEQDVEYSFNFDGGENRDRFYLFVGPMSSVDIDDDLANLSDVNIWSAGNKVYVSINSYDLIDAKIEIVDMLGKSVTYERLYGTYNIIDVPGASGTYFVKVKTKDGKNHMNKVFIQK